MPNPFGKSRTQDKPYAIYKNDSGWEWRVLKTYKLAKNEDNYSRWFVAATSPYMNDGGFELGDDYAVNIRQSGYLVQADDGWLEAYPSDGYKTVPTEDEINNLFASSVLF